MPHHGASQRLSAVGALEHPYIAQFHNAAAERVATRPVRPTIPDDEKKSTNFYRDKLYAHITSNPRGQDGRRDPPSSRGV